MTIYGIAALALLLLCRGYLLAQPLVTFGLLAAAIGAIDILWHNPRR